MSQRSITREYLEALIIAAIFLQFANTFVVQTYYIPSGSMMNTISHEYQCQLKGKNGRTP